MASPGSPSVRESDPLISTEESGIIPPLSLDSVRPPFRQSMNDEHDDDKDAHEVRIGLSTIVQVVIIIVTISVIIVEILACPGHAFEISLTVLDWAALLWYSVALTLAIKARYYQDGLVPPISLSVGKKLFHLAGPRELGAFSAKKPTSIPLALRNSFETVLALGLFSLTIAGDVTKGGRPRYRAWYSGQGIVTVIEVLHFFIVAFIGLVLYLRSVEARKGYSAFIKVGVDRKTERYEYAIQLPPETSRKDTMTASARV